MREKAQTSTNVPQRFASMEEEEASMEEDLFVFNDTIEGPRAPAVKQCINLRTHALHHPTHIRFTSKIPRLLHTYNISIKIDMLHLMIKHRH